jgi:GT2 family glycosyltransferase
MPSRESDHLSSIINQSSNSARISVVIVNYNTCELLKQCLESLNQFEPQAEVFVVDNASRDGSEAMVRENFHSVQVIQSGRNAGFAAANNLGIAHSTGEYLILLNSDTQMEDSALTATADWMDANPCVGATSPGLIGTNNERQECQYPWPNARDLWRQALKLGDSSQNATTGWLAGTCLVLRRVALDQSGGQLDEKYWMYWEDADLSFQIASKGWLVVPFEGATIRHHGGASGGGADANRRADLHGWYLYGKYRWFRKNAGLAAVISVCLLDALDLPRKWMRSLRHPDRTAELTHARVQASALWNYFRGRRPNVP